MLIASLVLLKNLFDIRLIAAYPSAVPHIPPIDPSTPPLKSPDSQPYRAPGTLDV